MQVGLPIKSFTNTIVILIQQGTQIHIGFTKTTCHRCENLNKKAFFERFLPTNSILQDCNSDEWAEHDVNTN